MQLLWPLESLSEIDHAHRNVLHQDFEVVLTLSTAQGWVHFTRFGVDEPGLQYLAVAGEQRIRQRAVTPEEAVTMQFHQQAGHRIQQALPVLGLIGWKAHEQAAVLPGPFEIASDEDRGVEFGLQHQTGRAHRGKTQLLEPAQGLVFPAWRSAAECPCLPRADRRPPRTPQVAAGSYGNIAQRNVRDD